jgi:hypothetical protein
MGVYLIPIHFHFFCSQVLKCIEKSSSRNTFIRIYFFNFG